MRFSSSVIIIGIILAWNLTVLILSVLKYYSNVTNAAGNTALGRLTQQPCIHSHQFVQDDVKAIQSFYKQIDANAVRQSGEVELTFLRQRLKSFQNCTHVYKAVKQWAPTKYEFTGFLSGLPYVKASALGPVEVMSTISDSAKVELVIALPVVYRGKPEVTYIEESIQSLLTTIKTDASCHFVISIAEPNRSDFVSVLLERLKEKFSDEFTSKRLTILLPPRSLYPSSIDTLKFPLPSTTWHVKQMLDFAYLLAYASTFSEYVLLSHDDIATHRGFDTNLRRLTKELNENVFWIEISPLIPGYLFRSKSLPQILAFLCSSYHVKANFSDVLHSYANFLPCSDTSYVSDVNPPATLQSSFRAMDPHTFEAVYSGGGYLHAINPKVGDYASIKFKEKIPLSSIEIMSGSDKFPGDVMCGGEVSLDAKCPWVSLGLKLDNRGMLVVPFLNNDAIASIPSECSPVSELTIKFQQDCKHWLVIREIIITSKRPTTAQPTQ